MVNIVRQGNSFTPDSRKILVSNWKVSSQQPDDDGEKFPGTSGNSDSGDWWFWVAFSAHSREILNSDCALFFIFHSYSPPRKIIILHWMAPHDFTLLEDSGPLHWALNKITISYFIIFLRTERGSGTQGRVILFIHLMRFYYPIGTTPGQSWLSNRDPH